VTAALARLTNDDARPGLGRLRVLPESGDGNGVHVADTPELALRAAETLPEQSRDGDSPT
jgi:hypothetical protein